MSDGGVNLALLSANSPSSVLGRTPSSNIMASCRTPSIIGEQKSIVKAMPECPEASRANFGLAPPSNVSLTKVCRRSVTEADTPSQLSLPPLFQNLGLALREYLLPLSVTDDLVAMVFFSIFDTLLPGSSCSAGMYFVSGILEV